MPEHERAWLQQRVTASIRRRLYERLLRIMVWLIAGFIAFGCAVAYGDPESVVRTVATLGGVFILALGAGAAIHTFVFAHSRVERLAFGFVIVSVGVLASYGVSLADWIFGALFTTSILVGVAIGIPLWSARGVEAQQTAAAFAALPLDVEAGEVLVFRGEEGDDALLRIEVLPRSRLRYHEGATSVWEWEPMEIDGFAEPPEPPPE